MLEHVSLIKEVQQLISFRAWDTFFSIKELVYQELSLDFLSTFSLEERHINWSFLGLIQFRVHDKRYQMSYMQFAIYMGLYFDK